MGRDVACLIKSVSELLCFDSIHKRNLQSEAAPTRRCRGAAGEAQQHGVCLCMTEAETDEGRLLRRMRSGRARRMRSAVIGG